MMKNETSWTEPQRVAVSLITVGHYRAKVHKYVGSSINNFSFRVERIEGEGTVFVGFNFAKTEQEAKMMAMNRIYGDILKREEDLTLKLGSLSRLSETVKQLINNERNS